MGGTASSLQRVHFFLLRRMFLETDLLVIFNTKRCRYKCHFCQLPEKSVREWVSEGEITSQFANVLLKCKHALSLLDRVTLSNEGSVLDESTFPRPALEAIVRAINELRRVRRLVLETRIEYVDEGALTKLNAVAPRTRLDVLTGFETLDERIRDEVLGKQETLAQFIDGLDRLSRVPRAMITCYVLLKPDPTMSDAAAIAEALESIRFLKRQTEKRGLELFIRLNPMYSAEGSAWARRAQAAGFLPPRLSDALEVARETVNIGVSVYIGLSAEGLAPIQSTYMAREDYTHELLKEAIIFNQTLGSRRGQSS